MAGTDGYEPGGIPRTSAASTKTCQSTIALPRALLDPNHPLLRPRCYRLGLTRLDIGTDRRPDRLAVRFSGRSGLTGQAGLSVGVSACGWVYGLSQVSGRDRFHGLRGTNMCLGDIDSSRDLGRDHNMLMLDHLGECLRGETRCPERPVILSNYNYIGFLYEGYTPPGGEMIWLGSAVSRSVPIQVHRWITDV